MKEKEPDLTEQIRAIFGTTDVKELRQIAEDAACYRKKGNSANRNTGRQKKFFYRSTACEYPCVAEQGVKITEIKQKIPCHPDRDLQSDKTCA